MSFESTDSEMLTAELAAAAQSAAGEHPGLDLLADYLAGALEPAAAARLNDHLVACRSCTQEFLDLKAFEADASLPQGADSEFRMKAAWRTVHHKIDREKRRTSSSFRRSLFSIAAALLLPIVGLSGWVVQLRSENSNLRLVQSRESQPEVNPWMVDLSVTRRSLPPSKLVEVPAGKASLSLSIYIPDTEPFSGYELELLDATGQVIWSKQGLQLGDSDTLEVRLGRSFLKAGDYRLRCIGQTADGPRTLVDQEIRIRWL